MPYPIDDLQYYQISAIDHHSSWRLIRNYPRRTLKEVISFLDELEKNCPFPIVQIQTDNAVEFTDKYSSQKGLRPTEFHAFDEWCKKRNIDHRLIPLGEKEINGKVENSHKWDDEEFYSQKTFKNLAHLQAETIIYSEYWNSERYTKTLGWRTPDEVVELAYIRAAVWVLGVFKNYPQKRKERLRKTERILTESGYMLRAIDKTKKKPKRKSYVDRYLEWLDWDEKKLKALPVPLILPIFSDSGACLFIFR